MFLLFLISPKKCSVFDFHLHSNMFLLFPESDVVVFPIPPLFTFQYVSIISEIAGGSEAYTKHLHSNMFLLFQRILCILAKRK